MNQKNYKLYSENETMKLAQSFSKFLRSGDIICLMGDLGAGKTTFIKGVAKGLNINPNIVSSPTYVLMNEYKGKFPLYHFDLYRLNDMQEIIDIGYDEFLYGQGVSALEWAEHLKGLMPKQYLQVKIDHLKPAGRKIRLSYKGIYYKEVFKKITEVL